VNLVCDRLGVSHSSRMPGAAVGIEHGSRRENGYLKSINDKQCDEVLD